MINPQTLHDAWLVVTVITTLEISGIALFLLMMFRDSSKRRFFWTLALLLASVSVEQCVAEIKNLYGTTPTDVNLTLFWLAGRIQEAIVAGAVLGYMIFGRNGKSTVKE